MNTFAAEAPIQLHRRTAAKPARPAAGATRFCMGAAWRSPTAQDRALLQRLDLPVTRNVGTP